MKEKLTELIEQAKYCSPEEMAEYLIAAGLVLSSCNRDCRNCWKTKLVNPVETDNNVGSKWIPVTERLPGIGYEYFSGENPNPVLYMMKSTRTIYAGYYGEYGTYRDKYFRQYHDRYEGVDVDDVLCWMWQHDLPEPPKEVE